MLRAQIITKMFSQHGEATSACNHGLRWMVTKAANRAAVHGSKLPVPNIIPEKVGEMKGAIEENERKRKKIENSVDFHLKNWQVIYVEDIMCSK